MVKPTAQQVQEYADSIGFDLDVEYFIAKNDAIGWMVGSKRNAKPMVSWKGCVRTWHIAAKRRQKQVQATVGEKVVGQPSFKPTVFVQCVKGLSTGRYMPIVFKESHIEDVPDERYILAAESMCKELSQVDGTEWIVRADVDERTLMKERGAATGAKDFRKKEKKKKGPLGINKEVYEQIKEAKETFHHPPPPKDGSVDKDVHFPKDDIPF